MRQVQGLRFNPGLSRKLVLCESSLLVLAGISGLIALFPAPEFPYFSIALYPNSRPMIAAPNQSACEIQTVTCHAERLL